MSWFDIIKVQGQGGMSPQEQTKSTQENQILMDRVKSLGVKPNDPRLAGRFNPEVYRMIINEEEAKQRQPQQTQQQQQRQPQQRQPQQRQPQQRQPQQNVKLPDSRLTPQERAEQNKQRNLRNQTPLPKVDTQLSREEMQERNRQRNLRQQVSLPEKEQPPKETKTVALPQKTQQQQLLEQMRESVPLPKQTSQQPTQQQISRPLEQETVPLPKNLSPKVKQKLQRNEVKQVPLPKTPEKEELSPEVRQQLQRKVGQVANPPVDGSPLSRTEQFGLSLSEKARKRREAEIARLKGGINQRQQQRQSNIRERPSRISSGGL